MSSERWVFTSYEKMAESSSEWQLDDDQYRQLEKIPWVVTEKIHGAHFCFVLDGQTILCANRKHVLGVDEEFFQYQVLVHQLQEILWNVFRLAQATYPQMSRVSIYGELFGGSYPHPEVPPDPSVQPVQTGVWYAPSLKFCAFDLGIERDKPVVSREYVDYDEAMHLFQETGLFYAVPLLIGSYQEALAYPLRFRSTIPGLLGLPPLQEENKAEGIVIKPLKTMLIATRKGAMRPVLKRKIAEFAEDKRFHQAQKWSPLVPALTPNHLEVLKWEVFNLVTDNRLYNVLSKLGALRAGDRKKSHQVFGLLVEDVLEQLELSQGEAVDALTASERSALLDYLHGEVRTLLKEYARKAAGGLSEWV